MPYKHREQRLQYNRQYHLLKIDKLKEKARKAIFYQKNKDKILQRCKQYRDKNLEKERERSRKYYESNWEKEQARREKKAMKNATRKREKYREQYPDGKENSGHW